MLLAGAVLPTAVPVAVAAAQRLGPARSRAAGWLAGKGGGRVQDGAAALRTGGHMGEQAMHARGARQYG